MRWIRWIGWTTVAGVITTAIVLTGGLAGAQTIASIMTAKLMEPNQKSAEVSTQDLEQILAEGSGTVFDARPHLEWAISHIPGAVNVAPKPGVPMAQYVSDVTEVLRQMNGDKSRAVILYCNGPFCGKSKRLAEELLAAGFANVRRYQLGAPTWRALVGVMEIELDGALYAYQRDKTAVLIDAREREEFAAGTIPGARSIPRSLVQVGKDVGELVKAKNDGRLPMEDHNTRIIVFGKDSVQARFVAEQIGREAFHNVAYFVGTYATLRSVLK
jgi:rhodanese-related sulfurtransferase